MKILSFLTIILLLPNLCFGIVRSFDGTNDEIDMSTNLDVTTGNVTVCAWVKPTEDASADIWVGKKSNILIGTAGYAFYQQSGDLYTWIVSDAVDACWPTTSDLDGVWTFFCGVWNQTSNNCPTYHNGVQQTNTGNSLVDSLTNAVVFQLGEDASDGNDANGLLAYVSQFSAELTAGEIIELMWKPESVVLNEPNGFWPMFGGDSPEIDLSKNAFTGTVSNATTNANGPPVMFGGGLPL